MPVFGAPTKTVPVIENDKITDIYFAKKVLTPAFENTPEVVVAKKGDTEKTIKARFIKAHKLKKTDITDYTPETAFVKAVGKEKVTITYRKKVADKVSYEKITHTKIKQKVWVVAICDLFSIEGKLSVEIMENKQTNAEAVYDNPIKFLEGDAEKTKLEFDLGKDKTLEPNIYAKEIALQPKSKDDVKKLIDKFAKRKDKNAFLYLKGTVTGTAKVTFLSYMLNEKEVKEFLNTDGGRLEIYWTPCYCNRDLTVEEMTNIVKEIRDNTFYYDSVTKKDYSITHYHGNKLFYLESLLPKNEKNNYNKLTEVLNKAFSDFNINTCIRKINFLAQMYPETMFFTDLSENFPSTDLGIYYGRGFIQLTHKGDEDSRTKNAVSYLGYKKYSKLDVITTPDLICKSLDNSADSAGWFWRYGKRLNDGSIKDLNSLADKDDANEISRLVNGGENARKERLEANKQLKKIFEYEDCINKK
jgi:predicted chitinase